MNPYLFFDSASTTKCCEAANQLVQQYSVEDYGNPSSLHAYGKKAARAIREARLFFAEVFYVEPEQVIFTGSGTEANNLAITGIALQAQFGKERGKEPSVRVLASTVEHPAVHRAVTSLEDFGIATDFIPVDTTGQVREDEYESLLVGGTSPGEPTEKEVCAAHSTGELPYRRCTVVSIQHVNNIVGSVFPVEKLAKKAKELAPSAIFHTDAIQSFGKIPVPRRPSSIDLISISGHKVNGPKGVGALIVLNPKLISTHQLRPLIWGGGQENGFRSGTQHAGLIAGFHIAAQQTLESQKESFKHIDELRDSFRQQMLLKGLLHTEATQGTVHWNSPPDALPHIVSLSVPGLPPAALTQLLEERGCLVSVGSACHSRKVEPEPVLAAMGYSLEIQNSGIRVSFSKDLQKNDVETLVQRLDECIRQMFRLKGRKR